jgi:hypothetical protein
MLCEIDLLARSRGEVVFLQSGTLLQVVRDGTVRADDDDMDVGHVGDSPEGPMCRLGYVESGGGYTIDIGHPLAMKRFTTGTGNLAECRDSLEVMSKIEFWPYAAKDANWTTVTATPPSLQEEGAEVIAVTYQNCMIYDIMTVAEGLNYTEVSEEGSDLKWRLPIQRYAEDLVLPQTFSESWRERGGMKSNDYMFSECGSMGATCTLPTDNGCQEISLAGWQVPNVTTFNSHAALAPFDGVGYVST